MTTGVAGALPSQDNAPDMDCFLLSTLKKQPYLVTVWGLHLASCILSGQWFREILPWDAVGIALQTLTDFTSVEDLLCAQVICLGYLDKTPFQSQWMPLQF